MGNDPAFLFYPNDFMGGTMFMSNEQIGKYIRLLCSQFIQGKHLREKDMLKICETYDKDIFNKFDVDDEGNYFNDRLEKEIIRRKNYAESRRQNRLSKPDKKGNISKTYVKHMVNENEAVNKDEAVIGNIIVKEIIEDLNKVMSSNYRDTSKKTISLINARLKEKFTFEDFKTVHRNMYNSWSGNIEMVRFLRPETLYGNKFESYLNQKTVNTSISDVTRFNIEAAKNFLRKGEQNGKR